MQGSQGLAIGVGVVVVGDDDEEEGESVIDRLVTSLPSSLPEEETEPSLTAAEIVRLDLTGDLTGAFDWEVLGRAEAVSATMDAPYISYIPTLATSPLVLHPSQNTAAGSVNTVDSAVTTPPTVLSPGSPPSIEITMPSPEPPSFIAWLRGLDWGLHHLHHEEDRGI
jgi:hypothetical protein